MGLREDLTIEVGNIFTEVWTELESANNELIFLRPSDTTIQYEIVYQQIGKWFFEYSNFRKVFLLEIAEDKQELTTAIANATHCQIDDDIYVIDQSDTTPPKSTDVTWKLSCNFETKRSLISPLR